MDAQRKITVAGVISEGIGLGIKNAISMLGATILWLLTIWIPYLNVGTTIAMTTIPIELSKGRVISPLFIFDGKYRKFMGEYFTLIGLMYLAIIPALFFMIVPGIIISIGWSLAIYILPLMVTSGPSSAYHFYWEWRFISFCGLYLPLQTADSQCSSCSL